MAEPPDTDEASPRGRRASAAAPRIDRSWTKLEKDILFGSLSQTTDELDGKDNSKWSNKKNKNREGDF